MRVEGSAALLWQIDLKSASAFVSRVNNDERERERMNAAGGRGRACLTTASNVRCAWHTLISVSGPVKIKHAKLSETASLLTRTKADETVTAHICYLILLQSGGTSWMCCMWFLILNWMFQIQLLSQLKKHKSINANQSVFPRLTSASDPRWLFGECAPACISALSECVSLTVGNSIWNDISWTAASASALKSLVLVGPKHLDGTIKCLLWNRLQRIIFIHHLWSGAVPFFLNTSLTTPVVNSVLANCSVSFLKGW